MKKYTLVILFLGGLTFFCQASSESSKVFLDNWCEANFDSCFSGRKYMSITVTEEREISRSKYIIKGEVSYKNYVGVVDSQPYKVVLIMHSSYVEIEFHKKSKNIFGQDYWEDCTKIMD